MANIVKVVCYLLLACSYLASAAVGKRTFGVDYKNGTFLKDKKPFRYISGSIHYHRIPSYYWLDRLHRAYMAGLNTVQFYVPWNYHEISPGKYDFTGDKDIEHFITSAASLGLYVNIRAGPYINNEWEFGGIPWWILKDHAYVKTRSMDPVWVAAVDRWMSVLLPKLKPHLYINGGNVLMVQLENEYGSYPACDLEYRQHLRDLFWRHLGSDAQLYTTDGTYDKMLRCGSVKGAYATIDFGPHACKDGKVANCFAMQSKYEPGGPWVNSEYYTGWIDHWGKNHAHTDGASVAKFADMLLGAGANLNFYTFVGATSFAFWNGANWFPGFFPQPTNYDFDAPIGEGAVLKDKYSDIRNVVGKYNRLPPGPVPPSVPKAAYGRLNMTYLCAFLDLLPMYSDGPIKSRYPLSMEQVNQGYGYILYRHQVTQSFTKALFNGSNVRDRAYVLVDKTPVALLDRRWNLTAYISATAGQRLDVLISNEGRINYDQGYQMNHNRKGLIGNVTLDGKIIEDWEIYPLDMMRHLPPDLSLVKDRSPPVRAVVDGRILHTPSVYQLYLRTDTPTDTFLNVEGWGKGQAYINSFNLGRYWPEKGPQKTLWVPANTITKAPFECKVTLIEMEYAPCQFSNGGADDCSVVFQDAALLNGTIAPGPAFSAPTGHSG